MYLWGTTRLSHLWVPIPDFMRCIFKSTWEASFKRQVVNMCPAKYTGNQPDSMLSNEHNTLSCGWAYPEDFGDAWLRHPLLQQKQISYRSQYMWQFQAGSIRLSPFFCDSPEEFKERILKWQYFRAALTPSLLCCLLISASQSATFKPIKHTATGHPEGKNPL